VTSTQQTNDTEKTVWKTPTWASDRQEAPCGMRYSLMATTIAVEESDFTADEPTPIKVEVDTYDHLSVIDGELRLARSAPQEVLVGNMRLTVPEAHKLANSWCEVLAAVTPIGKLAGLAEDLIERVTEGAL